MKKIAFFLLSMFFTINVFAFSVFASDEFGDVDIHGFISQGYLQSDDHDMYFADTDDGTFEFNEMGINFATDLTDELRLGVQFLAKDLGIIGNDEVVIDWAYADYRYRNWLGLQVGKTKKPMGFYNQSRDVDATRTMIFLPVSIYNENYRDTYLSNKGVATYGSLPGGIDYTFLYGVMDVPKDGGIAHLLPVVVESVDINNSFAGDLKWRLSFLEGLTLTYNFTEWDFTLNMSEFNGASGTYKYNFKGEWNLFGIEYCFGDFTIAAEHRIMDSDDNSLKFLVAPVYVDVPTYNSDIEDSYVMMSYNVTDWFSVAVCYSATYADNDDKDGKDAEAVYWNAIMSTGQPDPEGRGRPFKEMMYLKDTSISTRFDINEYWIAKLEVHFMDGLKDVNFSESDDPADPDPTWTMIAAKVSYSF